MTDHEQTTWVCPLCRAVITGGRDSEIDICFTCRLRPDWEALPQAVRDEVDAMIDAGDVMNATYRLRDLDHNRLDIFDYTLMVVGQNSRNSSGSIPRNAS